MSDHAKLSPSASSRWIACPGSIALESKMPEQKSSYALEGTIAHGMGELALREDKDAKDFVGKKCHTEGDTVHMGSEDMVDAVQEYVDLVNMLASKEDIDSLKVLRYLEEKVALKDLHEGIYGTADCVLFYKEEKHLTVIDYKHGKGVPVDPEYNTQMMIYALGACRMINTGVKTVEMTIVQPRADEERPIKTFKLSYDELQKWGLNVLRPAALSTEEDDAPLRVGKHCRFCKAIGVCPKQAEVACEVANTDFKDPVLPAPENLTPQDIVKVMRVSEMIAKWATGVTAHAQSLMEKGMELPGFKLVQKKANRRWVDDRAASEVLLRVLGDKDSYTRKLVSPAQAEKAFKKRGTKLPEHIWLKPDTGLTIADESDRRKAVLPPGSMEFIEHADWLE